MWLMIISKATEIRTLHSLSPSRRYTFGKTTEWGGCGVWGSVIVQAAKPKAAIMPVPFGLAVELGHVVG